jgi:hypothetical protein
MHKTVYLKRISYKFLKKTLGNLFWRRKYGTCYTGQPYWCQSSVVDLFSGSYLSQFWQWYHFVA